MRAMIEHQDKHYARVSEILSGSPSIAECQQFSPKARIGLETHAAIHEEICGRTPRLTSHCQGYFASFQKWHLAQGPMWLCSEQRYFDDELMITGCLDATYTSAHDSDSSIVVVDFKTSFRPSPSWINQLHFYHYLLKQNGVQQPIRMFAIQLHPKGHAPILHECQYSDQVWTECLKAIASFSQNHRR